MGSAPEKSPPSGGQQYTAEQKIDSPRKLYPVDESHLDPSFEEFKSALLRAVEDNDRRVLRKSLAPRVVMDFEGPSSAEEAFSLFEADEGKLWRELRRTLLLGATRSGSRFCAPYVRTRFPEELDPFEFLVITGSNVAVRTEPNRTAPVLETLSYDIVEEGPQGFRQFAPEQIEGETHAWRQIKTPSGKIGYVYGKYVRHPLDYRACFEKINDDWRIVSMVAGD
jgi:hypothetical protein